MKTANCPECNTIIEVQERYVSNINKSGDIDGLDIFDIVDCDSCFVELKIMGLYPEMKFAVVNGEKNEPN